MLHDHRGWRGQHAHPHRRHALRAAASDSAGINAPAVIGKGGKALCPQVPFQIAYKLEITGKKGAGDVRAQLFSKAKK